MGRFFCLVTLLAPKASDFPFSLPSAAEWITFEIQAIKNVSVSVILDTDSERIKRVSATAKFVSVKRLRSGSVSVLKCTYKEITSNILNILRRCM